MLTLLVLRHGKSDWGADFEADHERPLNQHGVKAAKLIGRFLSAIDLTPDSIVTSSAVRARTTVEIAAQAGGWSCPIRVSGQLYDTSPGPVIEEIQQQPPGAKTLLIAGHEPTWSTLTALLVGGGSMRFPAAALACIEFPSGRWADVAPSRGQLAWLINPKLLEPAGLKTLKERILGASGSGLS